MWSVWMYSDHAIGGGGGGGAGACDGGAGRGGGGGGSTCGFGEAVAGHAATAASSAVSPMAALADKTPRPLYVMRNGGVPRTTAVGEKGMHFSPLSQNDHPRTT